MVRLVEKVANVRVLEHPGIHLVHDVEAMRFERGDGRLDERNGLIAEGLRHQLLLFECVENPGMSELGNVIVKIHLHLHRPCRRYEMRLLRENQARLVRRSEAHTSELQSLMRISY